MGVAARTLSWQCNSYLQKQGRARKAPPRNGKGKCCWWLHRRIDPRLSTCPNNNTRDDRDQASLLHSYPQHHVERAYRKAHWMHVWRKRLSFNRDGHLAIKIAYEVSADAIHAEPAPFKISPRSLQTWWRDYNRMTTSGHIAGVESLIPKYGSGDGGGDDGLSGSEPQSGRCEESIEHFYFLWHTQKRRSIKYCHDATLRDAEKHDLAWPTSARSTQLWLKKSDDLALTCLMREGKESWQRKYMSFISIDWTTVEPGEWYVADHTICDYWVRHRGKTIRPWLTTIMDCRSRCVVGWHLGKSPHQDAIMSALRMAFRDWAICEHIKLDNGKDFRSKLFAGITKRQMDALKRTHGDDWEKVAKKSDGLLDANDARWLGLYEELGIKVHYAIPYAPWSKGIQERWYGTMHDQCDKDFATYCGKSSDYKPDYVEELRKDIANVPSFDDARKHICEYIDTYHRTEHSGLNNQAPLAVWHTASRLRKAVEDQLLLMMDMRGAYKVGANGVTITAGGVSVTYGQYAACLKSLKGRKVLVALDVEHCEHVHVLDIETRRLLGRLEANKQLPPGTHVDDLREAQRRVQGSRKEANKVQRNRITQSRSVEQEAMHIHNEKHTHVMKTGTDDKNVVNIVPVHLGVDSVSRTDRTAFKPVPIDTDDLEDLFEDEVPETNWDHHEEDQGMDDLFVDNEETVTDDANDLSDDLSSLL